MNNPGVLSDLESRALETQNRIGPLVPPWLLRWKLEGVCFLINACPNLLSKREVMSKREVVVTPWTLVELWDKHRASELWAELHVLVVICAEV